MARVDLFQHWVYENPQDGRDPSKCDERWAALVDQFNPGVDWSELEIYKMTGWQHTPRHIFLHPFYYVEYGLSSLGAFQIWRNSLRNPENAIASYRKALSFGGTLPLRQLYETAGARFALDADTLREIVDLIEKTIVELEGSL
jgi:oligoendopeptidase F